MKQLMKKLWAKISGLVPTRTPIGKTAFNMWASSIFDTYGLPNTPGYRQALATMIMHEKRYFVSKFKFALQIKKAQVNETAYLLMKEIQEEGKNAIQAAEATPVTDGVANGSGPVQQNQTV